MTPEEEEADSEALFEALKTICAGKRSMVIIPALTNLLALVVTDTALTTQGIESFVVIFKDELRRCWVAKAQPATPVDG